MTGDEIAQRIVTWRRRMWVSLGLAAVLGASWLAMWTWGVPEPWRWPVLASFSASGVSMLVAVCKIEHAQEDREDLLDRASW